jgi:hypothetical protein
VSHQIPHQTTPFPIPPKHSSLLVLTISLMRGTQKSPVHTPQQADHPIMRKLDPSGNDQILERLFAVLRCSILNDIKLQSALIGLLRGVFLQSLLDLK